MAALGSELLSVASRMMNAPVERDSLRLWISRGMLSYSSLPMSCALSVTSLNTALFWARVFSTTSVSSTLNRSIFFFYEKALRYVPILLMLCHWYGVYSFHDNPREIVIDIRENEECIAYLYFMVYIFPVVFMLPASHFFKLCWIWRIPFVYIIGTNAIRIYYRSWFITNEMYDADFILIIMTLALYACAFVQMICRSFRHK